MDDLFDDGAFRLSKKFGMRKQQTLKASPLFNQAYEGGTRMENIDNNMYHRKKYLGTPRDAIDLLKKGQLSYFK